MHQNAFRRFCAALPGGAREVATVRESCGADIEAQCPAVQPRAGRILLCVKQHFAALSERCKNAIGHAAEGKLGAKRE
jgi:hypothetical protein